MPSSACDWSSDVCSSDRSEEHTSELQSRSDLVCRLLLEKKKNKNTRQPIHLNQNHVRESLFTILLRSRNINNRRSCHAREPASTPYLPRNSTQLVHSGHT